ncbi:MAG: hypothetical protein C0407_03850 [Desulfobacca sp.]|nr:hypothetical protein [Desulfobacca sp.]
MPLAFSSLSHGEVVFGFFNIESDLLLLNTYFWFAQDFCDYISCLADKDPYDFSSLDWEGYILNQGDVGDLHGAISGTRLEGFIGEVYRQFPFPQDLALFKQNPEGDKTRSIVKELIEKYAPLSKISITLEEPGETIQIGDYLFSKDGLAELLNYLWLGGYPRWKQGIRPAYVLTMKEKVEGSDHPLFKGMALAKVYNL